MAGLVVMTGCNDDEGTVEVDPLVGVYAFTNATLATALEITLAPGTDPMELPVGSDVTELLAGILAAAGPCENPVNSRIELAEDGTFYYICTGEDVDRVDSGTWTSTETTITLTIASVSLDMTIPVIVSGYTISGNSFTGLIEGFPVPKDVTQDFGVPLEGTEGVLNFQFANVNATFTKLPN